MFASVYFISQEPELLSVSRSISQIKKKIYLLMTSLYKYSVHVYLYIKGGKNIYIYIWFIERPFDKNSGACGSTNLL